MSFEYIKKLPSPDEVLKNFPLSEDLKAIKAQRDNEIKDIFIGKDDRKILIIGPCSAHNEDAVCEYVSRLAALQEKVKDMVLLIPRIYTNKPRTTGEGYKGMLHQPDHQKDDDISLGLQSIRKMHLRTMAESHLPAADEMLYPGNYPYLADLLSYVAIGARSVENQQHRLTSSGIGIPVGMKNPTSGDLKIMMDSINAAQIPHIFIYHDWEVATEGNPLTHAVMRGSVDVYGNHIPNYHYDSMMDVAQMFEKRKLKNPAMIIDTNHSNSGKRYKEQSRIAMEVLSNMKHSDVLNSMVKGFMIESYLLDGSDPSGAEFGKSITDPCLNWDSSEKLVYDIAEGL